jgi:hypothetical protein
MGVSNLLGPLTGSGMLLNSSQISGITPFTSSNALQQSMSNVGGMPVLNFFPTGSSNNASASTNTSNNALQTPATSTTTNSSPVTANNTAQSTGSSGANGTLYTTTATPTAVAAPTSTNSTGTNTNPSGSIYSGSSSMPVNTSSSQSSFFYTLGVNFYNMVQQCIVGAGSSISSSGSTAGGSTSGGSTATGGGLINFSPDFNFSNISTALAGIGVAQSGGNAAYQIPLSLSGLGAASAGATSTQSTTGPSSNPLTGLLNQ